MGEPFQTILRSVPAYPQILVAAAVSAGMILGSGWLSGILKRRAGWPTGYTRKLFHFLIFFTAVGLHLWAGMPAVNVLGIGMGIFVLLAVTAGDAHSDLSWAPQWGQTFQADSAGFPQFRQSGWSSAPQCGQ